MTALTDREGLIRRVTTNAVNPILSRFRPAIFQELTMHRLKFGSRCPEFSSVHFSHHDPNGNIVLYAHMRLAADDMQAVISGHLIPAGQVLAGELLPLH